MDGFTRSHIKRLIENGRVTVGGLAVPAKYVPQKGEAILVTVEEPTQIAVEPQDIPLDIIYEDSDIIVINKGKGMVVHPAPGQSRRDAGQCTALSLHDLSGINGELRPGIVHRIDKDTTGLLVAAKNDAAHLSLAKQIQSKTAGRIYTALVYGRMVNANRTAQLTLP